jgi:hypothetical protein
LYPRWAAAVQRDSRLAPPIPARPGNALRMAMPRKRSVDNGFEFVSSISDHPYCLLQRKPRF